MAQQSKLTTGGQITVPAQVRKRWKTSAVTVEDRGDHLIVRPMSGDRAARVEALRGILDTDYTVDLDELRREFREEEQEAERRKWGDQ